MITSRAVGAAVTGAILFLASHAHADEEPEPAQPARPLEVRFEVSSGAGVHNLFDLPIVGWEAGAAIGVEGAEWGVYLRGAWFRGTTAVALASDTGQLEAMVEWRPCRFHLGIGAELVYFDLAALGPPGSQQATGVGVQVASRFDVVRVGSHELFLGMRLDADILDGQSYTGETALAGFRF